jgi:hypothetical protein
MLYSNAFHQAYPIIQTLKKVHFALEMEFWILFLILFNEGISSLPIRGGSTLALQ